MCNTYQWPFWQQGELTTTYFWNVQLNFAEEFSAKISFTEQASKMVSDFFMALQQCSSATVHAQLNPYRSRLLRATQSVTQLKQTFEDPGSAQKIFSSIFLLHFIHSNWNQFVNFLVLPNLTSVSINHPTKRGPDFPVCLSIKIYSFVPNFSL